MSNWQFWAKIQDFLGDAGPAATAEPSAKQLQQAEDRRRNGWALASFGRPAAAADKVVRPPVGAAQRQTLSAPPIPGKPKA